MVFPTRTPVPGRTAAGRQAIVKGVIPAGQDGKHAGGAAADDKDLTQYGNTDHDP